VYSASTVLPSFTGTEAVSKVLEKVTEGFNGVEKQAKDSDKYGGLDKGPAVFGVVKKARDNDMDLHSNQTVRHHHG
jgi:hypothetical protein